MSAGWTLRLFQCSDACRDTKQVESLFNNMKGPLSGGTIASLFGALLDNHGEDSKAVTDPYGLDPPDSRRGPDKGDSLLPGYSKLHKHFYFPFVMAPVNTRCVRRSNALLGHKYGERPLSVSLICQELPCPKISTAVGESKLLSLIAIQTVVVQALYDLRAIYSRVSPPMHLLRTSPSSHLSFEKLE